MFNTILKWLKREKKVEAEKNPMPYCVVAPKVPYAVRRMRGYSLKATKKGQARGAFGHCHATIDPRPALKPQEMRERYSQKQTA